MRAEPVGGARRLRGGWGVFSGPACPWPFLGRSVRAEPSGGARRFLGRGGSLSVSGGPVRAESSDGARRLWDGDCPARAPSPLAGLGAAASAAPGVRGFLGGRLSLCCEGERHCAAAGGRPLFGLRVSARRAFWRSAAPLRRVTAAPPVPLLCLGRSVRAEPFGGARRFLGRGGSRPVSGGPVRAESSDRARRLRDTPLPPFPSPPALGGSGLPPPGLAPLAPRLQAGSRGTAVRVTTLPFPMPTQAAPRVPLPRLRTCALGWSVLRWVGVTSLRGPLVNLLAGRPARPPPPSPRPLLPLPRLAVRGCPPGVSAVGSPAAGGVAGDCGPGHYPPLPHAYPGGASCSFPLFKNPRPWVECATVVGVSFLRGPLESLLAGRPARLPPRW